MEVIISNEPYQHIHTGCNKRNVKSYKERFTKSNSSSNLLAVLVCSYKNKREGKEHRGEAIDHAIIEIHFLIANHYKVAYTGNKSGNQTINKYNFFHVVLC